MKEIKHLSNPDYSQFIALSRYSRWLPEEGRREYWGETVDRYINFFRGRNPLILEEVWEELYSAIYSMEVMPSMRALMTAGEALERDNVASLNCSYTTIEGSGETIKVTNDQIEALVGEPLTFTIRNPICFDEVMYILMCGTGVGFSVERQYINNLPKVGDQVNRGIYLPLEENFPGVPKEEISTLNKEDNTIHVHDSKYGWSSALRILTVELYNGNFSIGWDLSQIREKGAPLKTFGGRASGPDPLNDLFLFAKQVFEPAKGRKLTSIECHDLLCKIGAVVVVGGVRRSACISLSNLTDLRMQKAKSGRWFDVEPQRALANNSVAYTEKPDPSIFLKEFVSLIESKSGERGFFNRVAAESKVSENGRRDPNWEFGLNPCGEIILRPHAFCNLTEGVIRSGDTYGEIARKLRLATILGTLQATLTDFRYLSSEWRKNTEEEALLGVSMTGIMDHPVMAGVIGGDGLLYLDEGLCVAPRWFDAKSTGSQLSDILWDLKQVCIDTNVEWARKLGINAAAAITTVKPSGTVSQLTDTSSGIHGRFSPYYIRTVRADKKDPISQFMIEKGVPYEENVMKGQDSWIFSFPMKSPEGSLLTEDRSAIEQLEHWLVYRRHWTEHNPSITIFIKEGEWTEVAAWVYKHFDEVSGISFLPQSNHSYLQAPYQAITQEEYEELVIKMPSNINWEGLSDYEEVDTTAGASTLACTGGTCEVVDLEEF